MRYQKPGSGAEGRWRERLKRWERSGLSITAFCEQEGVSLPSFFQWRKRLQPGRKYRGRAFVPVNIVPNVEVGAGPLRERAGVRPGAPAAGTDPRIEIHCGSLVLHVPAGVDEQSLRQVLRVAREEAARC